MNIKGQDIWCTTCSSVEHTKDNCQQEFNRWDVCFIRMKCFCDIFQEHGSHMMKDCPYNMKNGKSSWCAICEVKSHAMVDGHLHLKNRQNYGAVYQTNVVAQNNDNISRNNEQNEQSNQRYEFQRYEHQYDNRRGGFGGQG